MGYPLILHDDGNFWSQQLGAFFFVCFIIYTSH